jgi:glutamyl-tRNA reductase
MMTLLTLGLNHATAPVEVRERVVFEATRLGVALSQLRTVAGVHEAAIVSTCNRTEIYCALDSPTQLDAVTKWFHEWHDHDPGEIDPCLYRYLDGDVVRHLLRVASGLDSMVLGEPQIAGQLKDAFRAAQTHGAIGSHLGKLFQHAFAVAKEVRTHTAIGANPVSVAFAAITLAKQIFADLGEVKALLIGAGETIELVARHLHGAGVADLIIANRDAHRANRLAARYEGRAYGLSQLGEVLPEADIVVSSTGSTLPILGKGAVEQAIKRRRRRPVFMVDIAVPRDIEPEIGRLQHVFLYTVDDLREVIDANVAARHAAAGEAEEIINTQVDNFLAWERSLGAVETIKDFRSQADGIRQRTLEQARRMVERGRSPEHALEFLAHTLTTRLLHNPTVALRHAGRDERHEQISAARELFDLDDEDSP